MAIKLNEIINLTNDEYADWTICLNNANPEGIYSFEQNRTRLMEHISWHKTAGSKTSFRSIWTKYCLQFIRLDKDSKYDQWLFLGAFEVDRIITYDNGHQIYNLKPIDRFQNFAERLIIQYQKIQGPKQAKISTSLIETIDVVRILEKKYIRVDRKFEGYDHVSIPFKELKDIINSKVDNWRELLWNVNCVYLITDTSNGKLYVGSTYGKEGIWQRWRTYVDTNGTGGNKELTKLIKDDPDYAVKYFQFSILETFLNQDSNNEQIREREIYWKNVLDSKNHGYNDNL